MLHRSLNALLSLVACLSVLLVACRAADRGQSPAAIPAAIATAAPASADTNDLITDAGWECLPGARVADGKLVVAGGATGLFKLNDYRLRLQTREDVTISITVEANTGPGVAGLTFWNSLNAPGDAANWYSTAAKLVLGLNGGRVHLAVFDGTGATPAFTYSGREGGQKGPLALSVQRVGDSLVLRVADAEVARTKVVWPLTGGPLFFGPNVQKGKALTLHRLSVTDGAHPNGAEVVYAAAPAAPAVTTPALRTGAAARGRFIGAYVSERSFRCDQQLRAITAREFNMLSVNSGVGWVNSAPRATSTSSAPLTSWWRSPRRTRCAYTPGISRGA